MAKLFTKTRNKAGDIMYHIDEACWDGYQQFGMKKKGGKQVPNCVPIKAKKEMEINTKGMGDYLDPDKKDLDTKIQYSIE